jgi:Helix-turn-helix domain
VERVARSRTAQARQVEPAKVVLATLQGEGVGAIAQRCGLSPATVYVWLHRIRTISRYTGVTARQGQAISGVVGIKASYQADPTGVEPSPNLPA